MITFYDLASPQGLSSSSNAWKARLCLNYKGLDYRTEWLELPNIASISRALGIPPTGKSTDGRPLYTIPAIVDSPNDSDKPRIAVAESFEIARYLDENYPGTLRLIPGGKEGEELQAKFASHFREVAFVPFAPLFVAHALAWLNPGSQDYMMYEKAKEYGLRTMLDIQPTSKKQEEQIWQACREGWSTIDNEFYAKTDDKGPWFLGDTISFADFVVIGALTCLHRLFGEESEEWKTMKAWDNGRWARLYDQTAYLREVEH